MHPRLRFLSAAILVLSAQLAGAMDMRFDVATVNNSGDDTDWFGTSQLPALNFPSVNGHNIEQGGTSEQSAIQAAGNTLGVYYDTFDDLYSSTETPAAAVATIQSWIKSHFGNSTETGAWLVLNEVNGSVLESSSGSAYQTWLVGTMQALHNAGYNNVILYTSNSLANQASKSTWQGIAQYAYVADEAFIDGPVVEADNYSVATLQNSYQNMFNTWTQTAGVPASKLIAGEDFSVNTYLASNYWGADGISGTQWEMAIEARDLAIHNIPFAGFIGYAWDKDAQATGNPSVDLANQLAYEEAYASTLVTQSEVPAWTDNDGTNSWNDYLNWTGGLPSTTSNPYPLLASYDPNLPKQTAANFENAIKAPTVITLDAAQSVTTLLFNSPYVCTLAAGTGGTLTLSGAGASVTVQQGSDNISAPMTLAANATASLTGSLNLSGMLNFGGYTLTKTGTGALTLSGTANHAAGSAISVSAGTLNLNSDAGSSSSANLSVTMSGGAALINTAQHLASFSLTGSGYAVMLTQGKYLLTHSLSLASTSTFDLTDNDLIVDYTGSSPLAAIKSDLAVGYNHGNFNGGAIMSSSVSSHPGTTLGYAEASDVLDLSGAQTGAFDGQTVDAMTVLVKFTWIGDTNLDGVVNAADLARMAPVGTTNATWSEGDFNYDGVVNADDYSLFALGDVYGAGNISAVTPEPGWGIALSGFPLLAMRRRTRL